jgi:uncharacterized cysteine cluster protein YcgN (CxxCxxCC family)
MGRNTKTKVFTSEHEELVDITCDRCGEVCFVADSEEHPLATDNFNYVTVIRRECIIGTHCQCGFYLCPDCYEFLGLHKLEKEDYYLTS